MNFCFFLTWTCIYQEMVSRVFLPQKGKKQKILNLTNFHQTEASGLLVCHLGHLSQMHACKKNSIAICLTSTPILTGLPVCLIIRLTPHTTDWNYLTAVPLFLEIHVGKAKVLQPHCRDVTRGE